MAAVNYANRMFCAVQKFGSDDAGLNPVGAPQARLTIAAALADLAANYPAASSTNYHIVTVGPGVYQEDPIALPLWTFIDGTCDGEGQPTAFISFGAGGGFSLSGAWNANASARGGLSNITVIASAGAPIIDWTMPVPVAGNPARTIEMFNVHYNLTSMIFEATGTGDVFRATNCKQYSVATDTITLEGGTIMLDNFLSAATITFNDTGGIAAAIQAYGIFITSATGGIVFSTTTGAGVTARIGACDNRNLTLNKAGAGTLAVSADAVSIPLTANVFYTGTATTANLIRTTDDGGIGPGVLPTDYAAAGNAAGTTTITTTANVYSFALTVTVNDGRTTPAVLAIPATVSKGDVIFLTVDVSAVATNTVNVRNATAGGTILDTINPGDGPTYSGRFTYTGSAFIRSAAQIPA